jgi:hypothetical protein
MIFNFETKLLELIKNNTVVEHTTLKPTDKS